MKQASYYARRVKRFYNRLRRQYGRPEPVEPIPPVDQLLLGILQDGATLERAQTALERIRQHMVDYNELRVSPHYEIAELVSPLVPEAGAKAQRIIALLKKIYEREHAVDLSRLTTLTKKDCRAYLDGLDGLDPYTRAAILLLSLDCPAVPVDAAMLAMLREEDLVHAEAEAPEVQSFLERYLPAGEAMSFYQLCRRYLADHPAATSAKRPRPSPRRYGKTKTARKKAAKSAKKTTKTSSRARGRGSGRKQ